MVSKGWESREREEAEWSTHIHSGSVLVNIAHKRKQRQVTGKPRSRMQAR